MLIILAFLLVFIMRKLCECGNLHFDHGVKGLCLGFRLVRILVIYG